MSTPFNPKTVRCDGHVPTRGYPPTRQCARNGVVCDGGGWYCRTHAPSLVKKRKDEAFHKRQSKHRLKVRVSQAQFERAQALERLGMAAMEHVLREMELHSSLGTPLPSDPLTLAAYALAQADKNLSEAHRAERTAAENERLAKKIVTRQTIEDPYDSPQEVEP